MSNLVQGLCFKAKFNCPKRKAVAVAMADHAHDDGTNIWPSVARLSVKTEWSERTVQRAVRELQAAGLLILVEEGGHGAKSTNEYRFDMEALQDLADGCVLLVDNEGDSQTPCTLVRVSTSPIRVSSTTNKGVHQTPEPSKNLQEPSCAPERTRETPRAPAASKPTPAIVLTPNDPTWSHWLTWLTDRDRRDLVVAAEEAQQMVVASRWPSENSALPRIDQSQAIAKRKFGEVA